MRVAQFGADFHPNFLIPISGHWFLEVDSLYSIDTPCTIAYDATSSISERLGQVSRYKENPGILVRPHEIPAAAEADRQGAPLLDVQRPPIRVFGGEPPQEGLAVLVLCPHAETPGVVYREHRRDVRSVLEPGIVGDAEVQ